MVNGRWSIGRLQSLRQADSRSGHSTPAPIFLQIRGEDRHPEERVFAQLEADSPERAHLADAMTRLRGRDQRPAFDQMRKDAVRGKFHVLMVWSIDRLGRSVLHVANAFAELDAAGVALYSDQQAIDSTTPMGRAMIQIASVFGEQERSIVRSRVIAGLASYCVPAGVIGARSDPWCRPGAPCRRAI
jgi:resolvase-like protein